MRVARRQNSVDGYLDITQGAVLKTDGTRKTRRQLSVKFALGGAGTNGTPAD